MANPELEGNNYVTIVRQKGHYSRFHLKGRHFKSVSGKTTVTFNSPLQCTLTVNPDYLYFVDTSSPNLLIVNAKCTDADLGLDRRNFEDKCSITIAHGSGSNTFNGLPSFYLDDAIRDDPAYGGGKGKPKPKKNGKKARTQKSAGKRADNTEAGN